MGFSHALRVPLLQMGPGRALLLKWNRGGVRRKGGAQEWGAEERPCRLAPAALSVKQSANTGECVEIQSDGGGRGAGSWVLQRFCSKFMREARLKCRVSVCVRPGTEPACVSVRASGD